MRNRIFARALVGLLPLLCACSAYDSRYQFEPRPLEVGHMVPESEDRAASVLITVVGVHKRDVKHDIPASVELRIRVDNHTDEEIRLDPSAVQLFAANLAQFPAPVAPEGPLVVPPHSSGTTTLFFPFPDGKIPGGFDLEGVSTRWTLDIGGRQSTGNATFTRSSRDTGYYPVGIGFGWGFFHYDSFHRHHHHHHSHRSRSHRPVSRGR